MGLRTDKFISVSAMTYNGRTSQIHVTLKEAYKKDKVVYCFSRIEAAKLRDAINQMFPYWDK